MAASNLINSVLEKLDNKFKQNLLHCLPLLDDVYDKVEIKARALEALGQIITEDRNLTPTQNETVQVFDEVFADIVTSLYFSACGLSTAAHSALRRALELGVAIVYLWDLPHEFWGWKSHDGDLNFQEMLDHLTSAKYKTYLISLDKSYTGTELFDEKDTKKLYRFLSNTIHGKLTTHVAYLPNRFNHDPTAWKAHLKLVERVVAVLLTLHIKRFFQYVPELKKMLPGAFI